MRFNGSNDSKPHKLWIRNFLKPQVFQVLELFGIGYLIFEALSFWLVNDQFAVLSNILNLSVFIPMSLYAYYVARRFLPKVDTFFLA